MSNLRNCKHSLGNSFCLVFFMLEHIFHHLDKLTVTFNSNDGRGAVVLFWRRISRRMMGNQKNSKLQKILKFQTFPKSKVDFVS